MKRIICLIIIAVAACACSKPKTIPDEELKAIVREIFLTNAYYDSHIVTIGADTLDIYNPVFEKYGYKPRDLTFTIDNLSRRKSIRFTDIIDEVVKTLEAEGQVVFKAVAMVDSVDNRLAQRYKKEIYRDSVARHITKVSEEKKPELKLPIGKGSYEVTFTYQVDTADKNSYLQYTHQLTDTAGKMQDQLFRSYLKGERKAEKITIEVTKESVANLEIYLARTGMRNTNVRTELTIDSLAIHFFMSKQEARDSFLREMLPVPHQLFDMSLKKTNTLDPKDFVTLHPDTTGITQRGDSLVRQ